MKNFASCHPWTNLIFYISVILFGMIFLHPVFLFIAFFSSLMYYIKLNGRKAVKTFFTFLFPMLIVVTVINGLTAHYGVTVLYETNGGNNICLEPIVYGFVTGVMVITVIMWFGCFSETVNTDKLLCVMGDKMPRTALTVTMALRFVPMYKQRLGEISDAQKGFGMGVDSGNVVTRIRNGSKILSVLISWMLENAIETASSMKSRGYGLKPKTNFGKYRFKSYDALIITIVAVCDVIVVSGGVKGVTEVIYNPFFRVNEINAMSIIVFVAYVVMCILPFVIDVCSSERFGS